VKFGVSMIGKQKTAVEALLRLFLDDRFLIIYTLFYKIITNETEYENE
jgi:hypothetical protein